MLTDSPEFSLVLLRIEHRCCEHDTLTSSLLVFCLRFIGVTFLTVGDQFEIGSAKCSQPSKSV